MTDIAMGVGIAVLATGAWWGLDRCALRLGMPARLASSYVDTFFGAAAGAIIAAFAVRYIGL